MRRVALSLSAAFLPFALLWTSPVHAASGGSLDSSFGSSGKVLTSIGANDFPYAALLQPNGDIVVSASSGAGFQALRCLPNGSLDQTFGSGGIAQGPAAAHNGNVLAIQGDGRILVVGSQVTLTGSNFAISRLNGNGTVDTSFGNGGTVTTEFFAQPNGSQESVSALLVQADGKILAGGAVGNGSGYRGTPFFTGLARYENNGALDPTFGSGGIVIATAVRGATALAEDASGNIFDLNTSVIAEFSPNGTHDASVTPAPLTVRSQGGANAFLADGRFLFAQSIVHRGDSDVQAVRYTATGSLHPTFNNPPVDYTSAEARDYASSIALQPNGQAVLAGPHTTYSWASSFGLERVNVDGSLDAGFGSGGTLTTSFGATDDTARAVLVQPDGKIVAVGRSSDSSTGTTSVAIARYLG